MKICHICNGFPPAAGGTETHNYSIVKYLSDKGYDVSVIVLRPSKELLMEENYDEESIKRILAKDFSMPELPNVKIYNLFPKPLKQYYDIWKKVREIEKDGNIDVFDIHTYLYAIPFLFQKRKIILSLHFFELTSPDPTWPKPFKENFIESIKRYGLFRCIYWKITKENALKKITRIMVKYEYAKKLLIDSGIDEGKIVVIPHWVDVESINSKCKERKRYLIPNLKEDDFVFMFFGRLAPEKGPDILLEAFHKLLKFKNIKLVFLGDGVLRRSLEEFVKAKRVSEYVYFPGRIYHDKIGDYLSASDCIIFSNRYLTYEWALLESMAAGKPIAATNVAATTDILIDGHNALLAEPTPESLSLKMEEIINNPELAKRMAENAFKIVREKHSMKNLEKYEELLRKTLKKDSLKNETVNEFGKDYFVNYLIGLKEVEKNWIPLNSMFEFYTNEDPRIGIFYKRRFLIMNDLVSSYEGKWAIDVGSSWGLMSINLSKKGYFVVAIDKYSRLFQQLLIPHASYKKVSNKIFCLVGDCNYLPFLKESFDLIVCGEIIEHLHAPKRLLAETSMLLKHGGEMIITTPNADNIFRRILYRFNLAMNQEHVHEFNLKELNILLEGHSLKIKKSLFINFNIFPIGEYSLSKFPKSFLTFVYIPINDLIEKLPFVNSLLCDTIIIKAEKE